MFFSHYICHSQVADHLESTRKLQYMSLIVTFISTSMSLVYNENE